MLALMDELFLLPPCPVALPRAYWIHNADRVPVLSSQLLLIQPSALEFGRIMKAIETAGDNDYDMEIVNNLYGENAMILPHRKYDLLTGEFRAGEHERYLGNEVEEWDPERVLGEAKFLHFSDWPVPKVRSFLFTVPFLHCTKVHIPLLPILFLIRCALSSRSQSPASHLAHQVSYMTRHSSFITHRNHTSHTRRYTSIHATYQTDAGRHESWLITLLSQPWLSASPSLIQDKQPKCTKDPLTGQQDCRSRDLWNGFYADFARRRKEVCEMDVKRDVKRDVAGGHIEEWRDERREKRWWDFEPAV